MSLKKYNSENSTKKAEDWSLEGIQDFFSSKCGKVSEVRAPTWQDSGRLRAAAQLGCLGELVLLGPLELQLVTHYFYCYSGIAAATTTSTSGNSCNRFISWFLTILLEGCLVFAYLPFATLIPT